MGIWEMSLRQLILAGGPIMFPIILCSIIGLAIVIEKLIHFASINTDTRKLKNEIFDLVRKNKVKEAIHYCDQQRSPIAKILKSGLIKFGCSKDEIKESMEDSSLYEIPKLEKRLTALATIAHISPLLGLLGTVTGMTSSFHTIQVRSNTLNPISPSDLAGGIYEALLTTVAGLMVAIPTFVAYNFCVSRINDFILEMERAATELINLIGHLTPTT